MGHIHIGTLPQTHLWRGFNSSLKLGTTNAEVLTRELALAADERLTQLRHAPNLVYCLWLLMRLGSAVRRADAEEHLLQLGIDIRRSPSATGFLAQVSAQLRREIAKNPAPGPFAEFASLALRSVLTQTILERQPRLFEEFPPSLVETLRERTTPTQVGHLVKEFFADYLGRILRFYVDKILPRSIGPEYGYATIAESEQFMAGLSTHAALLATSTDYFAGRWFNLHDWTANGQVSREEVGGFVAHAVEKLQRSMTGGELQA